MKASQVNVQVSRSTVHYSGHNLIVKYLATVANGTVNQVRHCETLASRSSRSFRGQETFTTAQISRLFSGSPMTLSSLLSTRKVPVPPTYGCFSLALVMHSNEGGPGPRHNMKEDPGSSTLIMKREHGQEVSCDPGQVIRILEVHQLPSPSPPPSEQPGQSPLPPPSGTYPSPCQSVS
jgi:hypothetical protein